MLSFVQNKKKSNAGTKMPYLRFFYCLILNFGKTIGMFEINTLGFVKIQNFVQIKKFQIWDQKFLILVCFGL